MLTEPVPHHEDSVWLFEGEPICWRGADERTTGYDWREFVAVHLSDVSN
jgi:hypothetical protein